MTRVVLDTNIIISAVFWAGKPYEVMRKGLVGEYQLITSPEIVEEVVEKLRNKFHFPEDKIQEQVNIIFALFHVINTTTRINVVRDKTDNKIIECAIDGGADFIVTGDSDLLELKEHEKIKIITVSEFLKTQK